MLFLATLRDSWKSILIFCMILFSYGIMMMLIYPSVETMTGELMTKAEGVSLTDTETGDQDRKIYNLTWDLKGGAGEHVAVGTSDPFVYDVFKGFISNGSISASNITREMFESIVTNDSMMDQYGVSILYVGRLNYVEFAKMKNESFYFVVYVISSDNYTPVAVSEMVSDLDFTNLGGFEDWLSSPFVEGFVGRIDFDMTTTEGFMAVEFFSMWPLFFLIYIGIKSGGALAPHVEDKSMDILLATGYSRRRFLGEKLGVLGINLILVNIGAFVGILAGAAVIGESISTKALIVTFLGCIPVGIAFIGIGLVLSVLMDEGMKVTWTIMGLVVGMYVIDIVTNVVDALWADVVGYSSLFYYYDAVSLMIDNTMPVRFAIIPLAVGVAGIVCAFFLFQKKEIHT
ncbi:MAG: ABC transporter permease subunit [Thermoplasmatota archaeon]